MLSGLYVGHEHRAKCRSLAGSHLPTQTAGSGPLSTSDSVKTFLSGLQYEAKKGYNNLQVRTSSKLLGFKAETHTGQPTQGPCMLFAELCMLVCVLG